MAIMDVNLFSKSLSRTVSIKVILPVDKRDMMGNFLHEAKPLKTLYLLHGILGSDGDWIHGTRITEWAQSANLAVIMPAGENRFYIDQPKTQEAYGEFIGEELITLTRRMFPLSDRREDTYIAGLSMGGYGAIRNGLKYHTTFGCIGAFSSALIIEDIPFSTDDSPIPFQRRSYYEAIFGDIDQILGSDVDPKALVKQLKQEHAVIPSMYMACGTEDFLIQKNHAFRDFLMQENIALTYEEGEGTHSWVFWDAYLKRFLDWLPLEEKQESISSGHVV